MRLYVAGGAPNSAAAMANLQVLIDEARTTFGPVALEVIDVLKEPGRALADGILVSPTLVRLSPLPMVRIVGNLSDRATVRLALGFGE